MKQLVAKAIVLSRTNYGEADRIVTVLSQQGKVRLLAKGVRKIKSKLAGGIELFSISTIGYIVGRGELATLVSSRLDQHFGNIVKDMSRTMYAYQVLKIINKVTEDTVDAEYFTMLVAVLDALNEEEVLLQVVHLWFGFRLLMLGGHTPNLSTTQQGSKLEAGANYIFDFEHMGFVLTAGGPYSADHIKVLRLAQMATSPKQLMQVTAIARQLPATGRLVELLLAQQRVTIKL